MNQAIKNKLKPEWELFCQYYVSSYETFGNAVKSYAKAYDIDITNKSKYASCRTQGYRLLTNDDILKRINQLLVDLVMNDTTVDMQLSFLIMQHNDYGAKMAAIREYNALKSRITKKLELRTNPAEDILKAAGLLESSDDGQVAGDSESTPEN